MTWFSSQGIAGTWVASERPINLALFLRSVAKSVGAPRPGEANPSFVPAAVFDALDAGLDTLAKLTSRSESKPPGSYVIEDEQVGSSRRYLF